MWSIVVFVPLFLVCEFLEIFTNYAKAIPAVHRTEWLSMVPADQLAFHVFCTYLVYCVVPLVSPCLAVIDMGLERKKSKQSGQVPIVQQPAQGRLQGQPVRPQQQPPPVRQQTQGQPVRPQQQPPPVRQQTQGQPVRPQQQPPPVRQQTQGQPVRPQQQPVNDYRPSSWGSSTATDGTIDGSGTHLEADPATVFWLFLVVGG